MAAGGLEEQRGNGSGGMRVATIWAMAGLLMLAGCDRPKPRTVPFDPMALAPAEPEPAAPVTGLSGSLLRLSGRAAAVVDHIGIVVDPLNHPPAATPADQPILIDGFAFDDVAKAPARAVDVVVAGQAFAAAYGRVRPDVAAFHKTPALSAVGFRLVLPAGALALGSHSLTVRVIAADGKTYRESAPIPFVAQ